jgi:acyl-CoA synthetase (AMP-forming)/AMP-acid ligase II
VSSETNGGTAPWDTIPQMLQDVCAGPARERCALQDGDQRFTYAELFDAVRTVSAKLAAAGVEPGTPVGIWARNSWRWVLGALATWWRGAIVVPIPAGAKRLEAAPLVKRFRLELLLVDETTQAMDAGWEHIVKDCRVISLRAGGPGAVESLTQWLATRPAATGCAPAKVNGEDSCEWLFTSGSTGRPKAVIRRHSQVLHNRYQSSLRRGFQGDDTLLALSPFSHTLGLNGTLLRSLMLGATLVLARDPSPRGIATSILEDGVSAISAPPSLFRLLLELESGGPPLIRRLRILSIGSDKLSADLVTRLADAGAGTISCGYGMTECDSIASATSDLGSRALATTVGVPEHGISVRIADAGDRPLADGERGEIQVRGYTTTPGYVDDDAATARLYTDDGWLRTGDLGRRTDEGYLQILGRLKEVIVSHGYTLYPAEIEGLLLQSSMLAAVAVFGLPGALGGESCCAAVVPDDPGAFQARDLARWARDNLTPYKVPARFFVLDKLPLNDNGKVDRQRLRDRFTAATHD